MARGGCRGRAFFPAISHPHHVSTKALQSLQQLLAARRRDRLESCGIIECEQVERRHGAQLRAVIAVRACHTKRASMGSALRGGRGVWRLKDAPRLMSDLTAPALSSCVWHSGFSARTAARPAAPTCSCSLVDARRRTVGGTAPALHVSSAWPLSSSVFGSSVAMASSAESACIAPPLSVASRPTSSLRRPARTHALRKLCNIRGRRGGCV